jgi:hypothetical protein
MASPLAANSFTPSKIFICGSNFFRSKCCGVKFKTMFMRGIFLFIICACLNAGVNGQVIIASQDFEAVPATPTWTFSGTNGDFSNGTNGRGLPADANLFANGRQGWQVVNGTTTLFFNNQNLGGYTECFVRLRLAGMSVNTSNGIDGADHADIAVSTDGGVTYSEEMRIQGAAANQRWDFNAAGNAMISYDGDNMPSVITSSSLNGISTATIYLPPVAARVMVRITLQNNDANERWVIDDASIRGNPVPLPTHLMQFKAEAKEMGTVLNWTTASEENCKGFEVEKSMNAINFSKIGFVRSSAPDGNSSSYLQYSFVDTVLHEGDHYYRLRQIDIDGKEALGPVALVRREAAVTTVRGIIPNPARDRIQILVSSDIRQQATLHIYAVDGKLVADRQIYLEKGENRIGQDVMTFSRGVYVIAIIGFKGELIPPVRFVKD